MSLSLPFEDVKGPKPGEKGAFQVDEFQPDLASLESCLTVSCVCDPIPRLRDNLEYETYVLVPRWQCA